MLGASETEGGGALRGIQQLVPAAAGLAHREPLGFGKTLIFPATRKISGPGGVVVVPPRIMHLFLALADERGAVVTRDALVRRCWTRPFVGEDSLNGAIAELRKALRTVSAEDVSVETVPKTGYRLASASSEEQPAAAAASVPSAALLHGSQWQPSRRLLLGGGIAALGAAGFVGWRAAAPGGGEAAFLIERGSQALRQGLPDANAQGVNFFSKAVELEPDNAKGWGMLALAWRSAADYGGADNTAKARTNAEMAARRALAIDPRQSDALTALATLTPAFGRWIDAERRIRDVLAIDPANVFAVAALGTLLMSTGQVRACLQRLNWLMERDTLSPNLQFRRVYTLWSAGHLAEMDRTADSALQSWPRHPAVWFARFWTLAFTGRAPAAMDMLLDTATRPPMPAPAARVLELSVKAIGSKRAADIRAAADAYFAAAAGGPGQATTAIMVLSYLGEAGAALQVAQGFLLRRGDVIVRQRHSSAQPSVTDTHHRMAMMLWVPATQGLRLHPEFRSLCDGIGMVDYWRKTGARPDFREGSLATI
jgi:DNA-binding winged helix-turn-helix (wHTH) protein